MRLWLALALGACAGPDSGGETETEDVPDADGDGFESPEDCDDDDENVHPGATERCNGVDDDCDDDLARGEGDADGDDVPDCAACDAAGFWASTWTIDDPTELRTEVRALTTGLACSYSVATDQMFLRVDNHGEQVECVYTGRKTTVINEKPDPNTDMNTEHTWLQSEGADALPAKCDIHHLYPTDVDANTARGNLPFGEVVSNQSWSEGGSKVGRNASGTTVFEPRDAHKGNAARSMLYFAVRYSKTLTAAQTTLYLDWAAQDPVDQAEIDRSIAVDEFQAFENPFVACPDLAERVYGD